MSDVEVIITKSVREIGTLGQRKRVKLGYFRNYLEPKGLALAVNDDNLFRFKVIEKKEKKRLAELKKTADELAKQLDGKSVKFEERKNKSGKLYGSITPSKVAEKMKADLSVEVQAGEIAMPTSIKETGEFDIKVLPHPEVEINVKLIITAEEEEEEAATDQ